MHKIRIHGRGGQGAITTGQILAIAAFYDGFEAQTFPVFGVERGGAPVTAFVRIDRHKIHNRSQIYHPDTVLVLDASLLDVVDVTKGMKEGGLLIINSNKAAKDLKIKGKFNVHTIDATSIALKIFKKPIVNTPILGAYGAISRQINLSSFKKAVSEHFTEKKGEHVAELNKQAIEQVYKLSK